MTPEFDKAMTEMSEHLETKARLTKAEALLKQCWLLLKERDKELARREEVINSQAKNIIMLQSELGQTSQELKLVLNSLLAIPLWIRKIFRAD